MNLAKLFEARPRWDPKLAPYKTWRAELDALERGRKGMSVFGYPIDEVVRGGREFRKVIEDVLDRDLVIVLSKDELQMLRPEYQHVSVFAARPDQLWRIPAFFAMHETAFAGDGAWTAPTEALRSLLLGYTAAQRERWLAWRRQRQAGDSCATVYTLLTRAQRRAISDAGKRYVADIGRLTLFARDRDDVLRSTAWRLVPRGTTIARVGLAWNVYRRLFKPARRRGVMTAAIPKRLESVFHAGMRSNVQFLTTRGWV
jgi:hypothetical protein